MQSHGVIATALIKRATRIGLDRLEVSTFSGMIGDFLEQIVQYKERDGSSKEISRVAEQLETDLLEGKIEVKRPTPEAYPGISIPSRAGGRGTADESLLGDGI